MQNALWYVAVCRAGIGQSFQDSRCSCCLSTRVRGAVKKMTHEFEYDIMF